MLSISENANSNYLARVIVLNGVHKHPNAEKLQMVTVDFQNVIVGPDAKDGDVCVYFPVESQINLDFLADTNSFSDQELNKDKNVKGYFNKQGRVRAVKLRGEYSFGYIVPADNLLGWACWNGYHPSLEPDILQDYIGKEFDTIGDTIICKKYVVPVRVNAHLKIGKKPRVSRLVDGQVHLHVTTENLRKEAYRVDPNDYISITYKTHGTSWWVSNVLVKKRLNNFLRLLKMVGVPIDDTEYDLVYGSRKVVKNEYLEDPKAKDHFYSYDIWEEIKDEVKDYIPKGFTLYGEALGYTKSGAYIQEGYDYGCKPGEKRLQVYRITFTNADGWVCNLSTKQTKEFCDKNGLEYVHLYYQGLARDLFPDIDVSTHWHEEFIKRLESTYTDADCFMCKNTVPEEGIVLRKDSIFSYESYKLKSFRFLEMETKLLDENVADIESQN